MPIYNIAGLKVRINSCSGRIEKQAEAYLAENQDEKRIDIDINVSKKRILSEMKAHPELNEDDWLYMLTGEDFYKGVLKYQGILLHSSCVVVDGIAYAFSADSGVGKSTHTKLWLERFGDRAYMLNDDKPCIREIDGRIYACGTPWSGKYDYSAPEVVPLGGICFIERSKENYIVHADTKNAIFNIFGQTIRNIDENSMNLMLDVMENILNKVDLYELGCNISQEAVDVSYGAMKKSIEEIL